tara:strand:+ start:610 stop:786 length:177 start_codon:yes stop_codon:yes gene_type:complete
MEVHHEVKTEIEALLKTIGKITLGFCDHPNEDIQEKMREANQLTHRAYDKLVDTNLPN